MAYRIRLLPPKQRVPVKLKGAPRRYLCLQARSTTKEPWGTLNARAYFEHFDDKTMKKIRQELDLLKYRWMDSRTFPGGTVFRVNPELRYV